MLIRLLLALLVSIPSGRLVFAQGKNHPNFLLILADDMGFADAGCYGGEISTPNLDRLAAQGVRFTQFYSTSRCWPTRAALLTGYYPQQIRMDPPRGRLPEWTRLLPHYLKSQGYRSLHSGKWHITGTPLAIKDGGFDRSYRIEDQDRHFNPTNHWLNDSQLPPVPKDRDYYSTVAIADYMIRFLKEHASTSPDQPFFSYLAFTAPHFPLQALPKDIDHYLQRYLSGWDEVRRQRYKLQLKLGLMNCPLSPRESSIVPSWNLTDSELKDQISSNEVSHAVAWDDLTVGEQRFQATKMAIHAAMIDRMDQEIGRVLDQIKSMDALDNTIVMFASDNGASAEFLNRGDKHDPAAPLGSEASYLCLGAGWSTVGNTPFRLHKSWVHEGGISSPFIVHWPNGIKAQGELRRAVGHVIDIVPTILELAGVEPAPTWNGMNPPSLPGRSLVSALSNDTPVPRDFLYFNHENNHALRIGEWKLVSKYPRSNDYALYNLYLDRCEQSDLAAQLPERVAEMKQRWLNLDASFRQDADSQFPRTRQSAPADANHIHQPVK